MFDLQDPQLEAIALSGKSTCEIEEQAISNSGASSIKDLPVLMLDLWIQCTIHQLFQVRTTSVRIGYLPADIER